MNETIVSFYKFVQIKNPLYYKEKLIEKTLKLEIKGTILLAEEGINGMLAGSQASIDEIKVFKTNTQSTITITLRLSQNVDRDI